jgi:hypothetical protein
MRQIEGTAENMTELVVKGHADRAETGAAQPGTVEGIRS